MASCTLCNYFGRTKVHYNYDLAKEHAETHFLQMKIIDDGIEMHQIFLQCFPEFATANGRSNHGKPRSADMSKVHYHTKRSQLAAKRQVFLFSLIRKRVDRNGNVHCRLCSKGIKASDDRRGIQCDNVKEHAYCHLPTPLYRCRLCSDEAYFSHTSSTMKMHLRATHALPRLEQNYECLADQYHSEILAMMNKCYGDHESKSTERDIPFRDLRESKICKQSTRSKLAVRRQLLCHRLMRKYVDADRRLECRLCSKQLRAKAGNYLQCQPIMQHALFHLGKALYQCKKCSDGFLTRLSVSKHLKKKHSLPTKQAYYRCLADPFHDDIVGILQQCYGDEVNDEDSFGTQADEGSTSIKRESDQCKSAIASKLTIERQMLCLQLTRELSTQEEKLRCRQCEKWISVKKTGGVGAAGGNAMLHALAHLSKPIYRCKICSETFVTRLNVGPHVRTKHSIPSTNNYECLGDQFHAEIVEMLRKCYNDKAGNDPKPFKSEAKAMACVRRHAITNGSKQMAERQLFCYRLIRKHILPDGRMECGVCKERIGAKRGEKYFQSENVMKHALAHLKRPIYRCSVCSQKRPYLSLMSHHLKTMHALPLAKNYESQADEYHSEILAKLGECYGEL